MFGSIAHDFQTRAVPTLRNAASSLASQGFEAAPYIEDKLEDEMAPRMEIILAAFS